jgi:hypothetical protein
MPFCRFPAARRFGRRAAWPLAVLVMVLLALWLGVSQAAERTRNASGRDTARQTVPPGQSPSSRREPSRVRNQDEPPPTVPNRAPEVVTPPPSPPNSGQAGGG